MKIRMKHNHAVVEEVERSTVPFGSYTVYVRHNGRDGHWEAFTTSEWEPVPEERWRDVTSECSVELDQIIHRVYDRTGPQYSVVVCRGNGYRVRKVCDAIIAYDRYVFIIEKREG